MTWASATFDPAAAWHWVGADSIRVGASTVARCGVRLPLDRLRTAEATPVAARQCRACAFRLSPFTRPGAATP